MSVQTSSVGNTDAAARRRPNITTLIGGAGLVLAALIWLLEVLPVGFPVLFSSVISNTISAVLLLAASCVLAFGIRRESGIAGMSAVGKIALVVFGARNLAFSLIETLPLGVPAPSAVIAGNVAVNVTFAVAVVVAGIAIVHAGVLTGFARWALLFPAAVCFGIVTFLQLVPVPALDDALALPDHVPASTYVWAAPPLSLLVVGVTYLLLGQSAAIRRTAQRINEKW